MKNKYMERSLSEGECIDLSDCKRNEFGDYIIENFVDGSDYCDKNEELWIWSIGKSISDGKILASTTAKFYKNSEYECIWLR